MNASTLPKYLLGSREAILRVAASPQSLGVGALLVLSAGLAREYDGEDLLHEPWHALRPLGVSLVSGTLLFLIVHGAALLRRRRSEGTPPGFGRAYRSFLGLFWMTAPMAWLYALPFERFMSPVDAIAANLWMLALVSVWRVALMTRVVAVIYGIRPLAALFLVMFFADAVVFAVVTLAPTPVIDLMGGIRHSDRDALIASITFAVLTMSVLSAPLWILGVLAAIASLRPRWPDLSARGSDRESRGLLKMAAFAVIACIPLLFVGQPEQINRRAAERLLKQGDVTAGLAFMASKSVDDFPPHWDPPPRWSYGERTPDLDALRTALSESWPGGWVGEVYIEKVAQGLRDEIHPHGWTPLWFDVVEHVAIYGRPGLVEPRHAEMAALLLDHHPHLTHEDRESLERLIKMAPPPAPMPDSAPAPPAVQDEDPPAPSGALDGAEEADINRSG